MTPETGECMGVKVTAACTSVLGNRDTIKSKPGGSVSLCSARLQDTKRNSH